MSQVISSLLIGIGASVDKKSFDNVDTAIDGITSKGLQLGAVIAGAFSLDALNDFAGRMDALQKNSEWWGAEVNFIMAYQRAIQSAGGAADEAVDAISKLRRIQAGTGKDKAAFLANAAQGENMAVAEIILNEKDAEKAFARIAKLMETMTPEQQLRTSDFLGISQANLSVLKEGRAEFEAIIEKQKQLGGSFDRAAKSSAEFKSNLQDSQSLMESFINPIQTKAIEQLNGLLVGLNEFAFDKREMIRDAAGSDVVEQAIIKTGLGPLITGVKALQDLTTAIKESDFSLSDYRPPQPPTTNYSREEGSQAQGSGYSYRTQPPQPKELKVHISTDNQMFRAEVKDVIYEEANTAVQDMSTSEAG